MFRSADSALALRLAMRQRFVAGFARRFGVSLPTITAAHLLTALLLLDPSPVGATQIHYVARGTLERTYPTIEPDLPVGTPWSMEVTIDSEAADSDASPKYGVYSPVSGKVTLGTVSQTFGGIGDLALPTVTVVDAQNLYLDGPDAMQVTTAPAPLQFSTGYVTRANLVLGATSESLFTGDSLMNSTLFSLSNLNGYACCNSSTRFVAALFVPNVISLSIAGPVDYLSITVVPIPPAVWLFGSALGMLGWVRRNAI